ncbi:MAG: uncharacterized protein KVP18_004685 [Porospora cf. gigantea A]|nr:MAG: hypothetical protein KVP18_004685 [Porospora cf. gigantea A]
MAHSLLIAYQAHLDPLTSYMWETKPLLWPRTVARVMSRRQLLPTLIAPVMYAPRRWVAVFMMQMESYCTICELRAESDFIAAYCDRFRWLVAEMFNKNVGTMLDRLK